MGELQVEIGRAQSGVNEQDDSNDAPTEGPSLDDLYNQDGKNEALSDVIDEINFICMLMAILGAVSFVLAYTCITSWEYTSLRQTKRMSIELL